jgi:hypothetical protein
LGAIIADGIETGHVLLLCASVVYGWYPAKLPHVESSSGKAAAVANASASALFVLIAFIDGNRWATTDLVTGSIGLRCGLFAEVLARRK